LILLKPQLLPALRNVSGSYFTQDGNFNAVLLQIVCRGHESDGFAKRFCC